MVDGAVLFMFMDWRHLLLLLVAGRKVGLDLLNLCVWAKTNAGMGSLYRSQHELVFVLKNGATAVPHINNVQLGKRGRHRSNLWTYPGLSGFGPERQQLLDAHPTVKPVALVADAILDCSRRRGLVLDPFAGSGTTAAACQAEGFDCVLIEREAEYVTDIRRRLGRPAGADTPLFAEASP